MTGERSATGSGAELIAAIQVNDAPAVRAILAAGVDREAKDDKGWTALRWAILKEAVDVAQVLLAAGADPNRETSPGECALEAAAMVDFMMLDTGKVQGQRGPFIPMLVAGGANVAEQGPRAAYYGVRDSSVAILQALGEAGLDWSMPSPYPRDDGSADPTPLVDILLAQAMSGVTTPGVLNFLLQRGADPNRRLDDGRTLLLRHLLRRGYDDLEVLDRWIAANIDLNAADAQGATALMLAAAQGKVRVCERLLAAGADTARRDLQERGIADYAAEAAQPAVLQLLRQRASDVALGSPLDPLPAVLRDVVSSGKEVVQSSLLLLQPTGPGCWRWHATVGSVAAAQAVIERDWSWSRSPLGPFPVVRCCAPVSAARVADPLARQCSGEARVGDLLVLTLIALAPGKDAAGDPGAAEPIFTMSGMFRPPALAAAEAFAGAQRGLSMIAQIEALPVIADGYPDMAQALTIAATGADDVLQAGPEGTTCQPFFDTP